MGAKLAGGAEALYERIRDVGISDIYAKPILEGCPRVYKDPFSAMASPDRTRWLRLAGKDIEGASDFEYLSAYFDCVRLMPDIAGKCVFEEEAKILSGEELGDMDALEFWKKAVAALFEKNGNFVGYCSTYGVKNLFLPIFCEGVADIPTKAVFDPVGCLENKSFVKDRGSLSEFEELVISKMKKTAPPYIIRAELGNIDFVRGDHYHCGGFFDRLKRGERLDREEYSALVIFLLWDVISRLGDECVLCLEVGDDTSCARELISYLSMRGICPETHIAMTPETAGRAKAVADICLLSPKVSLDIVLGMEDSAESMERRIRELLCVYPIHKLRFGGVISDSRMFFAAHTYARRIIASALWNIYGDERAAHAIDILFGIK